MRGIVDLGDALQDAFRDAGQWGFGLRIGDLLGGFGR